MIDLLNLTLPELKDFTSKELGEPAFRANQIWQWMWQKGATSFEDMSNLSLSAREKLNALAVISHPELAEVKISKDGTVKFLLRLSDGALVESVLIPSESQTGALRMTQCLSCQVGCAMGCTFCSTGKMGFTRNMSMAEILGQVLVARSWLAKQEGAPELRNLVFMGMGEPLLNFKELMRSLHTLNNGQGLNFTARKITVSTCGIQAGLAELGESNLAYLAVSLHAPTQALRAQIMPKAARWPLADLMAALERYPLKTRERLTFEYLLLGGVNDSIDHAKELVRLLSSIKAKLNLIAYNAAEGSPYATPSPERILAFEKYLWSKGVTAVLRKSKGADIAAACGQLKTEYLKKDSE